MRKKGVGTNRYAYSFNDPVNLSDRNGNRTFWESIGDFFRTPEERVEENRTRSTRMEAIILNEFNNLLAGDIDSARFRMRTRYASGQLASYQKIIEENGGSISGVSLDIALGFITEGGIPFPLAKLGRVVPRVNLDLSRNCAAPLTAYYAQKENDYGKESYC